MANNKLDVIQLKKIMTQNAKPANFEVKVPVNLNGNSIAISPKKPRERAELKKSASQNHLTDFELLVVKLQKQKEEVRAWFSNLFLVK